MTQTPSILYARNIISPELDLCEHSLISMISQTLQRNRQEEHYSFRYLSHNGKSSTEYVQLTMQPTVSSSENRYSGSRLMKNSARSSRKDYLRNAEGERNRNNGRTVF